MDRWARGLTQLPDQFDWFSAYLDDRRLRVQWRLTTFVFTAALGALPILLLSSGTGPDHPFTVAVSVVSAAVSLCGAVLWLVRWPSRRQSRIFCLAASASIAGTCLSQSDAYTGLMGCTTFAVIGGFVAYFHSMSLVVLNLFGATICATVLSYRLLVDTGNIALTASAVMVVVSLNVGVPLGIQSLALALLSDLRNVDHDSLTGLLNRRSFNRSAYELLMAKRSGGTSFVVIMIDLDDFKRLNDTEGHAAGDRALTEVAAAIRDTSRQTAVIGRVGGEEFVIADVCVTGEHVVMAERLRDAIAALQSHVTASIGTASVALSGEAFGDQQVVDGLIRLADTAMYEAKRRGGNAVQHG